MRSFSYLYPFTNMTCQVLSLELAPGKKAYFASDFHFGIPDAAATRLREQRVCRWLDMIRKDAQYIFLLGDLFDSWMEYKRVVPRGTVRFLGKLAELRDQGIDIQVFTGNHDLWMHGYFEEELGIPVHKSLLDLTLAGKKFCLGHGDGVWKGEKKYLLMKAVLHHPVSQFLYRQLHPDLGLRLADFFSRLGPKHKAGETPLRPLEEEYQIRFARETLQHIHYDYFIFGHRHIPLSVDLQEGVHFLNLGDWISHDTYAVFDGIGVKLEKMEIK